MLKSKENLSHHSFPMIAWLVVAGVFQRLFAVFEGCIYVQYSVLKSPHNNCRKWDLFIKTPLVSVLLLPLLPGLTCMLGFHLTPPERMVHWNNCLDLFIILSKNHPLPAEEGMREYKGKCSECMQSIPNQCKQNKFESIKVKLVQETFKFDFYKFKVWVSRVWSLTLSSRRLSRWDISSFWHSPLSLLSQPWLQLNREW